MLIQVCEMTIGLPGVGASFTSVRVFDLARRRVWQQRAPESFRSFRREPVPDGFRPN